jgi:hypothetical protein
MSLDRNYTAAWDSFEPVARAHGETPIAKLHVREQQREAEWIIVLTDKALYKYDVGAPLNAPRKRMDLLDYYVVEEDSSNPLMFSTKLYKQNLKTSMKSSFMRIIGSLGSKVDLSNMFQRREYICQSEMQRDQFVFMMNRSIRNVWQAMLETHVIPAPEFYQAHDLVIKTSRKGAHQERLLTLSNEWLYNVEISHNPSKVQEVKWCVPLRCIDAVSVSSQTTEASFFFDHDRLRTYQADMKALGIKKPDMISKSSDTYCFEFTDAFARAKLLFILRHLCKQIAPDQAFRIISDEQTSANVNAAAAAAAAGSPRDSTLTVDVPAANSSVDSSMPSVAAHPLQESLDKPLMVESLEKLIKDGNKSHRKVFALFPDMTIKWGDTATKFKHSAKIISVMKGPSVMEGLQPEKRPKFFALRTTQKPLYLIAQSAESRTTWMTVVESLMTPMDVASPRSGGGFSMLSQLMPVIRGPMTKYIKGGKDKHVKYFSVYNDGTIKWGDNEHALKHSAKVVDIDQDLSSLGDVIQRQDAVRFIRILTTDKTLEMLCPNQDSADRWVSVVSKILNPDYEDDNEDHEFDE